MNEKEMVSNWLPCPVVFLSTAHEDKRDIMTATAMFVSEKEPLLAISVARDHLTAQLIERSGTFAVVIAAEGQKELAGKLGSVRGDREDKFKLFSFSVLPAQPGQPLIPADSAACLACRVVNIQDIDGYKLVVGRVIEQQDFGKPPLVWHKGDMFGLK